MYVLNAIISPFTFFSILLCFLFLIKYLKDSLICVHCCSSSWYLKSERHSTRLHLQWMHFQLPTFPHLIRIDQRNYSGQKDYFVNRNKFIKLKFPREWPEWKMKCGAFQTTLPNILTLKETPNVNRKYQNLIKTKI